MPIVGWLCHKCGTEVPLDHFRSTSCGETIPPAYTDALLADRAGQSERTGVRVTHLLGCVRAAAIELSEPFSPDPLAYNAMLTGSAWDRMVNTRHVRVKGTIEGVEVSGEIDNLAPDAIEDWKHGSDFSVKYRKPGEAKEAHVLQTSLYGTLLAQDTGLIVTKGRIWYHVSTSGKDAIFPVTYPLLPLDQVLAAKVGEYTVADLLHQANAVFNKGVHWSEIPQVGATIYFGTKRMCENYCSVRETCWKAKGGAPF